MKLWIVDQQRLISTSDVFQHPQGIGFYCVDCCQEMNSLPNCFVIALEMEDGTIILGIVDAFIGKMSIESVGFQAHSDTVNQVKWDFPGKIGFMH